MPRAPRKAPARSACPSPSGRPIRIQKLLAAAGVASRRKSEELLREGRVSLNGRTARLGEVADPLRDRIALDGKPVRSERPAYWIVHKPRGVVTTVRDPEGRRTILDLLPELPVRLFPVGRLDRDSEGLVLLTNDGDLAHVLLHPAHGSEREYRVSVAGHPTRETLRRLSDGIRLEDGTSAPARVAGTRFDRISNSTTFSLTLIEGRKRQIRRTMLALGHPVRRLVRVRMGPLLLGRLARGAARSLRSEELRALRRHAAAHPARRRNS